MGDPARVQVLAVEDDEMDLRVMSAALAREGYRLETAHTRGQALRALHRVPSPVLLVDLSLPDGCGLDVLRAAREADSKSAGILLTADADQELQARCLQQGAFDTLAKPCGGELLAAAVRRAERHYRLEEELEQKRRQIEGLRAKLAGSVGETAAEAASLSAFRGRLISEISHEFRSPLTVIGGYASLLLEKLSDSGLPESLQKGLSIIARNTEILQRMVEDLLELSRLESRKVRLQREPLDAAALVSDAVAEFALLAGRRSIDLGGACSESPTIFGDARKLRQVLGNLLSNALKFTPPGGRIDVRAWSEGPRVRFSVSDTGMGVPPGELERVFDRDYQSGASAAQGEGLGLGLAISKGLVELHGGRIWAQPRAGGGSIFQFTVPIHDGPPDPVRQSVPPLTARITRNGSRSP